MADWQTLSSKIVYESPWIKVHRDEILNQNGKPLTYSYMTLQNPSVCIIAINSAGEIFLEKVYRYTLKRRSWEIPGGFLEPGEDPMAAAKRELKEETGLVSDKWFHLGRMYQIPGTGNVPFDIALALDARKGGTATDADEDITDGHFVSLETVEKMIASGELTDAPIIAAIYRAKLHMIEHKEN
jgi:8-oxo-dGTP pyrophosphatase MutT (NUDIX family)